MSIKSTIATATAGAARWGLRSVLHRSGGALPGKLGLAIDPELVTHLAGLLDASVVITGTNGKTTTTYLVEHIARVAGKRTGVIGTVGIRIGDEAEKSAHTTPESPDLQQLFARMRDARCDVVAMEVSSHALDHEHFRAPIDGVLGERVPIRRHAYHAEERVAGLHPVAAVGDTVHLVVGVAEDGAVDTCEQFGTGLAHGFLTPDKC